MVQTQVYLGSHSVNPFMLSFTILVQVSPKNVQVSRSIHSILPPPPLPPPPAHHEGCESLLKKCRVAFGASVWAWVGGQWGCLVCLVFKFLCRDYRSYASLSVTQTWCPFSVSTSQSFSVLSAGVQSSATRSRLSLERL